MTLVIVFAELLRSVDAGKHRRILLCRFWKTTCIPLL